MTASAGTAGDRSTWLSMRRWRTLFRDRPLVPLSALLIALVVALELVQPGTVKAGWVGVTIRAAIPLAILGACQTLTMLTGGIDLSVGMIASMAAFVMATQAPLQGPAIAIVIALVVAAFAGMVNGIGIGVFKVHPLIMTLGMSLVILGVGIVYQLAVVKSGTKVPDVLQSLGSDLTAGALPNSLLVFVPVAALVISGLRYTGYGRLLFAVGDNAIAARLSGVRVWAVLLTLYVLSALLAAVAGFLVSGLVKTATVSLVEQSLLPSVAAAVIGGTSILGGRGGFSGTILGALILTVVTSLMTAMGMPEAAKQILFGAIVVVVAAAYTRVTGEA